MNRQLTLSKSAIIGLSALALCIVGVGDANAIPVQNAGFESTTSGPNAFFGLGISDPTVWATKGNGAIYAPAAADTLLVGATQGGGSKYYLWGPGDGGPPSNHLPAMSPDGGNYLAGDSDPSVAAMVSQIISGLVGGQQYALTFYYAAAQFRNADGSFWNNATDSTWQVSLGTQTQTAPVLNIAGHGFSGWILETLIFTGDAPLGQTASELLSFLAIGSPGGLPPAALLDGVSLTAVPEPDTLALLGIGLLGILAVRRKQRSALSRSLL